MLIKISSFDFPLSPQLPTLFILTGHEFYLLDKAAETIKKHWQNLHVDVDNSIIDIHTPKDWLSLEQKANSYSLFSVAQSIDVRFSKKSLDSTGKYVLEAYLKRLNENQNCLILIRAPELTVKGLTWLTESKLATVVTFSSPTFRVISQWISLQLAAINLRFDASIPELIYHHTEGNLLALAQILKKIELCYSLQIPSEDKYVLSSEDVKSQLTDLCIFSLYELTESCLAGDILKSLRILRQARAENIEPTLILWILTQEVRKLLSLIQEKSSPLSFKERALKLQIWSSKLASYQKALTKIELDFLLQLLQDCQALDKRIKNSEIALVWQAFDLLAIKLCKGKQKLWKAG